MKMLDKLPDDWVEQVQEVYNDLYANTATPPDIVSLPISWLREFLRAQTDDPTRCWDILKLYGMEVSFGFTEKPVCSIRLKSLQRHSIMHGVQS